jgi:rhamnosyltransferase
VLYNPDEDLLMRNIHELSIMIDFFIVDNSAPLNCLPSLGIDDDNNNIRYFPLESNVGLAAAQNYALEKILDDKAYTHVIFFDQDSVLGLEAFKGLIAAEEVLLKRGIAVGAVGPVCYDPNNETRYPVSVYSGPFISRRFPLDDEVVSASFLISSGMLVRTKVLEVVGAMDERFFIDYIDIEWSYRAQSLGYALFAVGGAKMSHLIGDDRVKFFGRSISRHSALRRYYLLRNSFLIMKLPHISLAYKSREIFLSMARFIAFFYYSDEKKVYSKLAIKAVIDAISGNYGKIRF